MVSPKFVVKIHLLEFPFMDHRITAQKGTKSTLDIFALKIRDKAYLCSCFGLYVDLWAYQSLKMELKLPISQYG